MAPEPDRAALEGALDDLYGVEPADFVATRGRLVAELRAAGHAAGAKELAAARRPTAAAAALNQVARGAPALVEEFLARSHELETVQREALAGAAGDLREATRAQRGALDAVFEAALATLGPDATPGARAQLMATLHAASVVPEAGEQLRQGRFVRELAASSGFPGGDGAAAALAPPARAGSGARASTRSAPDGSGPDVAARPSTSRGESGGAAPLTELERARSARAERQRLEQERLERERVTSQLDAARAELAAARSVAEAAEAAAEEADARVDELQQDLTDARDAARTARRALTEARRQEDRLARSTGRLESTVDQRE